MAANQGNNLPFIKNLASSDRKTRTSALTSLTTFLSSRAAASALSQPEILKLWAGLFYALWMCDRPVPQQRLCAELAGLVDVLPKSRGAGEDDAAVVAAWLRGFWATMAREWTGIDVLRMEKFLLLVRRVLGASFAWMAEGSKQGGGKKRWDKARADTVLSLLQEWPFRLGDVDDEQVAGHEGLVPKTIPSGLRIHVVDIWVDEAVRAGLLPPPAPAPPSADGEEGDGEARAEPEVDAESLDILQRVNGMVEALERDGATTSTSVRVRAKEALGDERLPWNRGYAGREGGGDGDSWDGFED